MATFVTGMHRSGTSMVARLLNLCGLYLGPEDGLLKAQADNPAGYWEDIAAVNLNDKILGLLGGSWNKLPSPQENWPQSAVIAPYHDTAKEMIARFDSQALWGWKDPRFCFTLPFWQQFINEFQVINCLRHPLAVAQSLQKRDQFPIEVGLNIWKDYNLALLSNTDSENHFVTHYDMYFTNPENELKRLVDALGWQVSDATISEACNSISRNLRHNVGTDAETAHIELPSDVADLYQDLLSRVSMETPTFLHPTGSAKQPLVSVVILINDDADITRRCLESVQTNTDYPHELIFVTTHNNMDSSKYLDGLVAVNSQYSIVEVDAPMASAAGLNEGLKSANGELITLMTDQNLVGPGWLPSLVSTLIKDEKIGMVGPIGHGFGGRQELASTTYRNDEEFQTFAQSIRFSNIDQISPRRRITSQVCLLRKDVLNAVDGIDTMFHNPSFFGDDLCLKVREAGYAIMIDTGTFVHHLGEVQPDSEPQSALRNEQEMFNAKWPDVAQPWLYEQDDNLVAILETKANKAISHISAGDLEDGRRLCSEVLRENPIDLTSIYGLGLIAHLENNLDEARVFYTRVEILHPTWTPAQQSLAMLEIKEQDFDAARIRLENIIRANPGDSESIRLLAQTHIAGGQIEDGLNLIVQLLKDNPDDWGTNQLLVSLYIDTDNIDDAKNLLERYLEEYPHNEEAMQLLISIR